MQWAKEIKRSRPICNKRGKRRLTYIYFGAKVKWIFIPLLFQYLHSEIWTANKTENLKITRTFKRFRSNKLSHLKIEAFTTKFVPWIVMKCFRQGTNKRIQIQCWIHNKQRNSLKCGCNEAQNKWWCGPFISAIS